MTTTSTMPNTDQATTGTAPTAGQFPTTAPFPPAAGQVAPAATFPPAAASAYPPPAPGPVANYPATFGPTGYTAEPAATARPTVPARRRTAWLIAGCTLLAVALLQLTRLPEWIAYDERGMVGNLTGVVALVGIGIALIVTGRQRAR